ncbi:uncharacterized protein LOC131189758 [Ahaetulla prasina]|uniref:uncharacterized protein LOC131189758 n=1 Tax=Ahaetulla prasina TaxID=499056 RepID=UPI00264A469F|nr:uncharacterized protein LOC131189758 [Ahaetulla prasina]
MAFLYISVFYFFLFFFFRMHIISLACEVFLLDFFPQCPFLLLFPFLSSSATASTSVAFPPTGTSLSCVGSDFPSPSCLQPEVWSNTDHAPVTLLPPFLSDQILHVNAHSTFLLFCQAIGSRDAHFVWKKNGQKMANCVNEQTHMLSNGRMHLLSWVKDAVAQDSEYTCLLISESGSKASTSSITVEGSNSQETWSRDFASWRSVIGQHEKLLENWKNTLVGITFGAGGFSFCLDEERTFYFCRVPGRNWQNCLSLCRTVSIFATKQEHCKSQSTLQYL